MMPSLGLSFSSLPDGDLVSRESQKTRKLEMEGGLLRVRVSNKTNGEDQFSVASKNLVGNSTVRMKRTRRD